MTDKLLKLVAKAVDKKSLIPLLRAVHVEDGIAHGTDAEVYVSAPTGKPDGSYSAAGHLLACTMSPAVIFEDVNGLADALAGEFRPIPYDLPDALRKVEHAISTEETRYYLNGVYFDMGKGTSLVATDGHRLARYQVLPVAGVDSFILPRRAVAILSAIRKPDYWEIAQVGRTLAFRATGCGLVLVCDALDSAYPDYNRVIPRADDQTALICGQVKDALKALRPLNNYGKERSKSLIVDGCDLSMKVPDMEPLHACWPVETLGQVLEFGINLRYLREALQACGSGVFTLRLTDAASPLRLECTGTPELTQVLMPLRI